MYGRKRYCGLILVLVLLLLGMSQLVSAGQEIAGAEVLQLEQETVSDAGEQTGETEPAMKQADSQPTETKGWHEDAVGIYYIRKNGSRAVGWYTISKKVYYFNPSGYRMTGWIRVKGKFYYLGKDGVRRTGWVKLGTSWYYFNKKGVRQTGWVTLKGKTYYLDQKGIRQKGWLKIGNKTWYLSKKGIRQTGWVTIKKKTYYFNKKGVLQTGWVKVGKKYYYLSEKGVLQTGWQTIGKKTYYLNPEDGSRASGLTRIGTDWYYFKKGIALKNCFTSTGEYVDKDGKVLQKSTLKKFLQTALQPVGSTLYVWGGGWNEADNGAGTEAVTIGPASRWKTFFNRYGSGYDYRTTRYQIHDGLDCSGYVGWVIYNAFNTASGNAGYVMLAQNMTRGFYQKGWGSYTAASNVKNYRAGDIMSNSGHVYIVIGQCSDGSLVLLHSSPPGVQISGTATRSGNANSQAVALASEYMKTYFPVWYAKFPDSSRGASYLTDYSQMRWYLTGNCMMSDPDGYAEKSPEEILQDLLG